MNRSSTPKARSPGDTPLKKPVHTPATKSSAMPMFAPVTGPRLTPEEAPASPGDWAPHRPARPEARIRTPFRLETKYTAAGDQPAAIAELVAQARRLYLRPTKHWQHNYTRSSRRSSRITRLNTLYRIMIITNPKLTFPVLILISKKIAV